MCCEWFLHIGWDISQFSCHHQSVEVFVPSQKDMLLYDTGSLLLWSCRGHCRTSKDNTASCCLVYWRQHCIQNRRNCVMLIHWISQGFTFGALPTMKHWSISCHCASFLLPSLRNQTYRLMKLMLLLQLLILVIPILYIIPCLRKLSYIVLPISISIVFIGKNKTQVRPGTQKTESRIEMKLHTCLFVILSFLICTSPLILYSGSRSQE